MAAPSFMVNIVDTIHVSAPAGSVPTTSLPLNYLDLPWFASAPMQSLFFYEFPHSTSHFIQAALPILKHSLSLTLQQFFPLAAKLMCPPPPLKPYIFYTDGGGDSVPLTVSESTADFNLLIANYPRDFKSLHPYVPELPPSTMSSDGVRVLPIMAVKVTVFPNVGVCIGLAHNHVAADGSSFMHFVRCWSSVCKSNGEPASAFLNDSARRPIHNREAFDDPNGCNDEALKFYWHWISSWRENLGPSKEILPADKVRATFVLAAAQIVKLKQQLTTQCKNSNESEQQLISTFIATCSIMWICMIKSEENYNPISSNGHDDDDTLHYFLFAVDCRSRTGFPLPVTYFGNCLAPGIVKAKKGDLMVSNGIVTAAEAIAKKVKEMESGALQEAQKGTSKLEEMFRSGHHVAVSGSPKFRVYDMDFGWGRPMKIEFIHIDDGGSLSFIESRDEPGGMEVSLVLSKNRMDAFTSNLAENLKAF
ncbi:HXXXD-type acyl-transferase family protein, putative isoform 1 [Hibiscus syriacus]|uniref:HXXXD-type acyl-transferase family protein, putative isoform 1 n=1 Tax=Hibiscus syriacus TaxID=106335 RepID=A0A6A3CZC8_HIBSY|nr:coumaroyl-CoA:anthocyanidin 3-O-glucoside-6''-O-coumaroyltransferase 1-like [Hibiscus syriacus]KAE8733857.1 HXXXD-type acyl-transferase family protein, putative isoform 1 [Hibiscus syriacus]